MGETFFMMTSSNGNVFRVTGPKCGEFIGPGEFPRKDQWRGTLMFSLICAWINGWVNNREAGDLRRHRGHYDVSVMSFWVSITSLWEKEDWYIGHFLVRRWRWGASVNYVQVFKSEFYSTLLILLPRFRFKMRSGSLHGMSRKLVILLVILLPGRQWDYERLGTFNNILVFREYPLISCLVGSWTSQVSCWLEIMEIITNSTGYSLENVSYLTDDYIPYEIIVLYGIRHILFNKVMSFHVLYLQPCKST